MKIFLSVLSVILMLYCMSVKELEEKKIYSRMFSTTVLFIGLFELLPLITSLFFGG